MKSLENNAEIQFIKADTQESCIVTAAKLKLFLSPERKTTRGRGNWGIKILNHRQDALAFEPGRPSNDWLYLPVAWKPKSSA